MRCLARLDRRTVALTSRRAALSDPFPLGDAVMSASSSGGTGPSCKLTEKTGTSMATPGAAGAALLARQYFQVNYRPVIGPLLTKHLLLTVGQP